MEKYQGWSFSSYELEIFFLYSECSQILNFAQYNYDNHQSPFYL